MSRTPVSLNQLIPRPWDLVSVYWARLLQWAKQKDVIVADPSARVSETIYGTRVVFESRYPWGHPFRTSVTDRAVSVRPGYVDDDMPTIGQIYLDGYDAEGVEKAEPVYQIPTGDGPGPGGRSFICLIMRWDITRRAPQTDADDWLTVGHIPDLDAARTAAGPAIAYEPLAICYWDGDKIAFTRQIVHHNLKHHFLTGEAEGTGKHFFSAV